MSPSEGYHENPFVAEFYDYVVPYRERGDVDFFVAAGLASGGPVLEIGCGTGRVLIPTARAGVEMTGLDSSPSMLAVCRRKLAQEAPAVQARVKLEQGDMRHFDLGRTFRLVTIPFRPFQHLMTVDDQLTCLGTVTRHLAPGGQLILDLFNPAFPHFADERFFEELNREPPFTVPDGRKVLRRHHIVARDLFQQTQDVELIYRVTYPDGREERLVDRFTMRYLFRFEAEHLLARAGFEVENVYADFDKSPYGSKHPGELVFVAHKR
jgi:SAM-dependent methyltransferase